MKKIDCFTFLNGFDVLKLRLAELSPYIDYFVLVESPHDLQGHPKPLYFQENPITGYKIKHVVVDLRWKGRDLDNRSELAWNNLNGVVEEGFRIGTEDADASDLGYYGDFDEIMRPAKLLDGPLDGAVCYAMELFVYWLNCRTHQQRLATSRMPVGQARASFWSASLLRYAAGGKHVIKDGGWHLTSFGGAETVKEKFDGYPDNPNLSKFTLAEIEDAVLKGIDISDLGVGPKEYGLEPTSEDLPSVILENPKDWVSLVHPDWRQ